MPKIAADTTAAPRTGLTLYAITAGLIEIDAYLDETDGELSPEVLEKLDALELALPAKVDGMCAMVREFESHEKACREESQFFATKARVFANKSRAMKAYLERELEKIGRDKVDGERFKVALQNSPLTVKYTGPADRIPVDYLVIAESFDTRRAVADYKQTGELPRDCEVVQGRHIRIR